MDYFKKKDGLQVNLSIYNYKVRNRTFTFMVELLVVVRVIDDTRLFCPKGGGSSSIQVYCIGHTQQTTDICRLIDGRSIRLTREPAVYDNKVSITLVISSVCRTRMSLVIELGRRITEGILCFTWKYPPFNTNEAPFSLPMTLGLSATSAGL